MDDTNSPAAPPPPPPPGSGSPSAIERKLSPGVLLLIAILAMVFFIFGLLNLLVHNVLRLRRARRRRRRVGDAATAAADGSSPTAFQGQLQQLFHLHDSGVDQAFIDSLPVFPYRSIAAAVGKDDGGGEEAFDCAVCLCEFAGDDKLRLLPTCGHAFHVPCIDAWLLSHSTCPLCRGSILAAADYYSTTASPSSSSLLLLRSYGLVDAIDGGGGGGPAGDRGGGGGGGDESAESPVNKDDVAAEEEEVVEVKLGKLRCVAGRNAGAARDDDDLALAADDGAATAGSSSNGGRGGLGGGGQRRCLSMGSYEYVMADHAALRVTVKVVTPKRRTPPAASSSSRSSRRRHALSACDLGCPKKAAGAWETAVVTEAAAASADCGDRAASLSRGDSFSTSKIWMASASAAARREEEDGRRAGAGHAAAESAAAGERRAGSSFRWPAMASGYRKHRGRRDEERWDVEAGGSGGDNAAGSSSLAEEERTPSSVARAAMRWVAAGGREREGSHS